MRPKSLAVLLVFLSIAALLEAPCRALGQQFQKLTYEATNPNLDWNPLRGFVADGVEQADSKFPHSMVWIDLPLRPIMTGPTSFDWKSVEDALVKVSEGGYQGILHFYVDSPGCPPAIPQFLLDEGLQTFLYTDLENDGKSVSPDYKDQRIVQAFQSFLVALAARYDGDPRIAFIVPGLYGFRGEWQVEKHASWEMFQFDKDLLIATMAKSFHKTVLVLRHPADSSNQDLVRTFGLHDASFIRLTLGGKPWNFWQQVQQANMTQLWKTRPTGGELSAKSFEETHAFTQKATDAGKQAIECIRTTHLTWLTAPSFFEAKGLPPSVVKEKLMEAGRLMGYQLWVPAFAIDSASGQELRLVVQIANRGIAPFYGQWPVEIGIVNGAGHLGKTVKVDWALPSIQPGQQVQFEARLSGVGKVDPGHLVMRVVPPLANGHALRFANNSQDGTLEGWLTLANLTGKKVEGNQP